MKKLWATIKELFRKERKLTVETFEKELKSDYTKVVINKVGKRTIKKVWEVRNPDNGYSLIKSGFETKGEALAYCYTLETRWYLTPDWKEI